MKFLCLIYEDRELGATLPRAEIEKAMKDYQAFNESIKRSGNYVTGNMVDTTRTKTVKGHNGSSSTKDGPYVKSKEQVGGYYVVEAIDLNEAVKIAAQIPSAKWGAVEVKPIAENKS
jgi:hypothetical protein